MISQVDNTKSALYTGDHYGPAWTTTKASDYTSKPSTYTSKPSTVVFPVRNFSSSSVRAASVTAAPDAGFSAYTNTVPNFVFRDNYDIGAGVGQINRDNAQYVVDPNLGQVAPGVGVVAQGDWGQMAAADAARRTIRDWGLQNMAAAAQGAIDRGMGRSGVYDAAQVLENYKADLAIQEAFGNAAAEQGRINSGIAMQNGATEAEMARFNAGAALDVGQYNADRYYGADTFNAGQALDLAKANQSAWLSADEMKSGYSMDLADLAQRIWMGNSSQKLAYIDSNRGYAMDQATLAENARQANQTNATTHSYQSGMLSQSAAELAAKASGSTSTPARDYTVEQAQAKADNRTRLMSSDTVRMMVSKPPYNGDWSKFFAAFNY